MVIRFITNYRDTTISDHLYYQYDTKFMILLKSVTPYSFVIDLSLLTKINEGT